MLSGHGHFQFGGLGLNNSSIRPTLGHAVPRQSDMLQAKPRTSNGGHMEKLG
jgi:hypothetical protein